ncbi:MAG: hypothetical protein M3R02_18835, partial [Chloroflexota bacterium]|nr:hypothetical protein [Chloroflexota bacterium]
PRHVPERDHQVLPFTPSTPYATRKRSVLVWRRDLGSARVPPGIVLPSSRTREFTPVTPNPSPPSVATRHPRPTAPPSRTRALVAGAFLGGPWDPGNRAGDLVGRACRRLRVP